MRERTITYTGTPTDGPGDAAREPGLVLVFVAGPRVPVGHSIDKPRVIGRGQGADILIDDPSVSRAHLTVEPAAGGVLVRDMGSHNGTFVDRSPVTGSPRHAPFGSVVRLGKALMIVSDDVRAYDGTADTRHPTLVGGPSLALVRSRIDMVKTSPFPVLVEGETGAGKEVVARAIHEASGRRGQMVEVNCAAIPPELVESELFGHTRGAFSGSERARVGLFRTAHEGTLLLDEIGELPIAMQAKLLRVLETGQVRPVGEDHPVATEVRVIAATNRSLDTMAEEGTFRLDLLHRIAAVRIQLPPLRERREDIPLLARHFLAESDPPVGAAAMELLLSHRWPGNARELRNVLVAAAAAARAEGRATIGLEDVAVVIGNLERQEDDGRARIVEALAAAGGNVTQAAKDLGVARSGLYETIRRLKLDPASFRR